MPMIEPSAMTGQRRLEVGQPCDDQREQQADGGRRRAWRSSFGVTLRPVHQRRQRDVVEGGGHVAASAPSRKTARSRSSRASRSAAAPSKRISPFSMK